MCCLAVLVSGPVSANPLKPVPVQSSTDEGPVFVDKILKAKSTRRSGFAPYKSSAATLGGEVFERSLMTEVGGAKPSDTISVLTLKVDGKYERFQATVGRSDNEARNGPAFAYFEVWGDGTCFFRSPPIRSAASAVTVPTGASIRKTPQDINITIRGTRTLQIVTRYASALDQQAPGITRAQGCVWGDPRLLTAAVSDAPGVAVTTAPITTPTPAPASTVASTKRPAPTRPSVASPSTPRISAKPPAQTPPPIRNSGEPADPRRNSVRMTVLLLASGVGSATSADAPQPSQTLRYPMKIALLPLRPSNTSARPTDAHLQKILEDTLPTARRGNTSLFTLLDRESTTQLTRLLQPSLMTTIVEPTSKDILPLASFCRARQVNAVLIPTLLPGSGTTRRGGSRLDLRLFDAESGVLIAHSVQIISSPNRN